MKINVHAGHNAHTTGASSILDETKEDRIVKDEVIRLLKAAKHTVYDCTDDLGKDINGNLSNIVKKCNSHKVDLDVSIHLNCGRNDKKGDGDSGGTEVFIYSSTSKAKQYAARVCENISKTLNIHNRGVKVSGNNLYVLRYTNAPAMLIECVFVDDKDDAKVWDAKKCAKAIVEAILNKKIDTPIKNEVVAIVEYLTLNNTKAYLNVYKTDTLTKAKNHGRYSQMLKIGTSGARNCYSTHSTEAAKGKSYCKKEKGTTLYVRNIKDLPN